jgi:hypothetical protein
VHVITPISHDGSPHWPHYLFFAIHAESRHLKWTFSLASL